MATKKSLNLTDLFYKKSETRTRQEITDEIARAIFNLELFVFAESYNQLPTGANIRPNKVYIVPNSGSNIQHNRFDFYMYYNNQWERVDAPDFDIEDYVKISDIIDNVTSNAANKPLSANQGKVLKALIDNKVDKVTGKGLSTNDFTNTYKSKLDSLDTNLNNKVDKVAGKGLSEADFTNNEKTKLAGIANGATRVIVDSALSSTSTNPVQNKVIVSEFYTKDDILDLLNNIQTAQGKLLSISIDEATGDLIVDDDGFQYYTEDEVDAGFTVDVVKQTTPESGFFATYVIKQGGVVVGTKINIPKDFLIKSASIKTSTADNTPIPGIMRGDKYFDFVLNTKDGSATDEHMYLNAKDLVDIYRADETTLTMDANNVFSIKEVPVAKITGVLPANQVTHQDISSKVDKVTGKGLSKNDFTDEYKIMLDDLSDDLDSKVDKVTGKQLSTEDYTSAEKTKLSNIEVEANKTIVDSTFVANSTNPVESQLIQSALDDKVESSDLATVATSGSYNDLSDKPSGLPPAAHTHSISEVTNLQTTLNGKMSSSDYNTVTLSVVFEDDTTGTYNLLYQPVQQQNNGE